MSAEDTLSAIDALIEDTFSKFSDHNKCGRCGKWHKLRPNSSGIARYTCCDTTYDVNTKPPGR